jgi:hypothetical protein
VQRIRVRRLRIRRERPNSSSKARDERDGKAHLAQPKQARMTAAGWFAGGTHHRHGRSRRTHQTRLDTTAAWRETPYYSARERAALAWCDALIQLPRTGADYRRGRRKLPACIGTLRRTGLWTRRCRCQALGRTAGLR